MAPAPFRPLYDQRVVVGDEVLVDQGAEGGAHALGREEVLVRHRQPGQGPDLLAAREGVVGGAGPVQRILRREGDDGVDLGVDAFDLRQVRLHHLEGGQLLRANAPRQLGGGLEADLRRRHRPLLRCGGVTVSRPPTRNHSRGSPASSSLPATSKRSRCSPCRTPSRISPNSAALEGSTKLPLLLTSRSATSTRSKIATPIRWRSCLSRYRMPSGLDGWSWIARESAQVSSSGRRRDVPRNPGVLQPLARQVHEREDIARRDLA